jgi:uncharacterized protein YjbJ (UPF0337 family)
MNQDRIKGKMKDVEGKVQRKVGELTGNKKEQLRGMGKQAEGKLQGAMGKVEDAGKDARKKMEDTGRDVKNDVTRRKLQGEEARSGNGEFDVERDDEEAA